MAPAAQTLLRELFAAAAGVVEIAFENVLPASQDSLNVHRSSLFFQLAQSSPRLCSSVQGSFLRSEDNSFFVWLVELNEGLVSFVQGEFELTSLNSKRLCLLLKLL